VMHMHYHHVVCVFCFPLINLDCVCVCVCVCVCECVCISHDPEIDCSKVFIGYLCSYIVGMCGDGANDCEVFSAFVAVVVFFYASSPGLRKQTKSVQLLD
jgi:hypothetical protein